MYYTRTLKPKYFKAQIFQSPYILHNKHGLFAGFLLCTMDYYFEDPYNKPQLTLSVTNTLYIDLVNFKNYLNGFIYFDNFKTQNGYY
jgi:hypothetical protein